MSSAMSMRESLISTIRDLGIDCILIPGDLTSRAKPSEFRECYRTVLEIAEELSIDESEVIHTFGNHDADWSISRLADAEESDEHYHTLAAHAGSVFTPGPKPDVLGPVPGSGVHSSKGKIVFVLNSGYYCTTDQEYPHGKLGETQLKWFERQVAEYYDTNDNWQILMLHHHPRKYSYPTISEDISHLEEGAELLDIIGQSAIDVVCHGHRHQAKLFTQTETAWKSPKTFLCAGSVAVNSGHRNEGEFPNMFHVLELHERHPTDYYTKGLVRSFAYNSRDGWTLHSHSSVVPIDGVQCFGPPVTDLQIRAKVKELIDYSLASIVDNFVELPDFKDLPFDLKCIPAVQLNETLASAINERPDLERLIGAYPNDSAIKRVSS